jgi:hypothetical protein
MPQGGALSLEQKKKLLWGKKAEPAVPKASCTMLRDLVTSLCKHGSVPAIRA